RMTTAGPACRIRAAMRLGCGSSLSLDSWAWPWPFCFESAKPGPEGTGWRRLLLPRVLPDEAHWLQISEDYVSSTWHCAAPTKRVNSKPVDSKGFRWIGSRHTAIHGSVEIL